MTDGNKRVERAVELLIYAPLGAGLSAIDIAPSLAEMFVNRARGEIDRRHEQVAQRITTVRSMGQVAVATHEDATLGIPTRFALGFMKSMDNRRRAFGDRDSALLSSAAFGHVGAGGSIGFADPVEGLSFGYSMNQMGQGILLNARGQSLVDAAYRVLGYRGNEAGVWTR